MPPNEVEVVYRSDEPLSGLENSGSRKDRPVLIVHFILIITPELIMYNLTFTVGNV